jgi:DNA-binding CsgD family transcriptional regulator
MKEKIATFFFGDDEIFEPEHRFLNFSLIFVVVTYIICFPFNIYYNSTITIIDGIIAFIFLALYLLSRINQRLIIPAIGFFVGTLTFLSASWIYAGGINGGTPYYYFSLIVVILFISKGRIRKILGTIVIIEFYILLILEYLCPQLITNYKSVEEKFWDVALSFVTAVPFVIGRVFYSKLLWMMEKKNTVYIIEQYRKSSENLQKTFDEKTSLLSMREREIFKLIIEGKTNKEIASILNIEERTVKNHITSIYKKIEVKKRSQIINNSW